MDHGQRWAGEVTGLAETGRRPAGVDSATPNTARMYDYYLGGKDNYLADREAAKAVLRMAPYTPAIARQNRRFLARAVRHLVHSGIRQFLDIGAGLPTQDNVHQVAQGIDPAVRVVYVDNDPVVITHGRALLAGDNTIMVEQDVRRPAGILADPEVRSMIDFTEPVGLLLVSILHCLDEDDAPYEVTATLRDGLPVGSHIAIAHCSGSDDAALSAAAVYRRASTTMVPRSREQVLPFFDETTLLEPGLVPLHEWRPDAMTPLAPPEQAGYYLCGVGRKDGR